MRRHRSLLLATSFVFFVQADLLAQAKAPSVDDALNTAAELLVSKQEAYKPDPPVGSLPEKKWFMWISTSQPRASSTSSSQTPPLSPE